MPCATERRYWRQSCQPGLSGRYMPSSASSIGARYAVLIDAKPGHQNQGWHKLSRSRHRDSGLFRIPCEAWRLPVCPLDGPASLPNNCSQIRLRFGGVPYRPDPVRSADLSVEWLYGCDVHAPKYSMSGVPDARALVRKRCDIVGWCMSAWLHVLG